MEILRMPKGELIVVGTGISVGHITMEARSWISSAEKVLYCVADAATERFILKLNPNAESLYVYYGEGKPRVETYRQMTERTMECVREGKTVCAVYYGHPGIFVAPSHHSIKIARQEGFSARMLPAVSALDCLFCDLGIDPSTGCQMFEATDLLLRRREIDVFSHMILWQIAATGDLAFSFNGYDGKNVPAAVEYLLRFYPPDHEVTIYEASQYPVCEPVIRTIMLNELMNHKMTGISTLYIPPIARPPLEVAMLKRLGLQHFLEGKTLVALEPEKAARYRRSNDVQS
jgi:uncharacterized protein YabN with tetrapyrrole methylase and pyrophosphatase domain